MRPILAFTAAALVSAPAYAETVAPGTYDYIDGCIVLNGDTLIAYGTAPIAFPRLILSCGDPTGAATLAPDPIPGPADTLFDNDMAEESGFPLPPPGTGLGNSDVRSDSPLPEDAPVQPGDALEVPEPAAAGLIGLGLSVLGLRRKRSTRAKR
jgi:hypothetical protein